MQSPYDTRAVYFIGDLPSKHDVARTVSGRKVNRKRVLRRSGGFFAILLAFWTMTPLLWWFALSHLDSEGNSPEGGFGVLVFLAMMFALLGSILSLSGTLIAFIEGMLGDHWNQVKTLRGTNLSAQRERCVPFQYDWTSHFLYEGPASMEAFISALRKCNLQGQAMNALLQGSDLCDDIKPHADAYLRATATTDELLASDSLSKETREQLQAALNELAEQCVAKIAAVLKSKNEEADRQRQSEEDATERRAIEEALALAEQIRFDAMLALSDMQVASLKLPQ